MQSKDKKVYIEIIRILAIFLVLYCHTGMEAVQHYAISGGAFSYFWAFFMRSVSYCCNMLFLMISGALLLPKAEKLSKVVVGRVLKFIAVIVIFSMLQFLFGYMKNPEIGWDSVLYLKVVYNSPVIFQYWYLYTYLGFLIILPLLRVLIKGMEEKHYWYLLAVGVLVAGILPIVERWLKMDSFGAEIPFLTMAVLSPIMGYFIDHVVWEKMYEKKALIIINVVGFIAVLINMHELEIMYVEGTPMNTLEGLSIITAIAIFVDVKAFCIRFSLPKVVNAVFVFIGSGVFGVYLLEPQVRELFHFIYEKTVAYITWFPAAVLWLIPAILAGSLVMNVLKRIPVVNKLF